MSDTSSFQSANSKSDSDESENDQEQTFINLNESLSQAMATAKDGKGLKLPKDPIYPNPLDNLFKAQPTAEETDPYEVIPDLENPNAEQQKAITTLTRFNTLKRDRTNIYSSITRMTNTINKVMGSRDLDAWKDLETRATDAKIRLWNITSELNKFKISITKEENIKAFSYQTKIETAMAKITAHVQALEMGIDECIAQTSAALEPEMPMTKTAGNPLAGIQAKLQQDADARATATTAAAAGTAGTGTGNPMGPFPTPPPMLPAATGGAAFDPTIADGIANFFATMARYAPPPPVVTTPATATTPAPGATVGDYRGLKPIEIKPFHGDALEYHYFKKAFEAAHDYRKLPKTAMALLLQSHLKGAAGRLAQMKLKNKIDDTSYQKIWDTLDERYGGDYNETQAITEQFVKLPVLTSFEFKDLERAHYSFELQKEFFETHDPQALTNAKSNLSIQAKQKLNVELGNKFIRWCGNRTKERNFLSLYEWLTARYQSALASVQEHSHSSKDERKARVTFLKDGDYEDEFEKEPEQETEPSSEEQDESPDFALFTKSPGGGFQKYDPSKTYRNFSRMGGFPKPPGFNRAPERKPLQLNPTDICVLCREKHEMRDCPKFRKLGMPEKRLLMRSSALCYHCLSTKHFIKDCHWQEGKPCGIRECQGYHHPLLHVDRPQVNFEYDLTRNVQLSQEEHDLISHLFEADEPPARMMHLASNGAISLQTIVLNVATAKGNLKTVALLDTGSTLTAIDEDFALKHKFKILQQREGQEVYTVDRLVKLEGIQYLVEVLVSSIESDTITYVEAWTIKNLVQNCAIVDWQEQKKQFPHLRRVRFPQLPANPTITILFGINSTKMFKSTQTVTNPDNPDDPVAIKTLLGWTCIGRSANPKQLTIDPTSQLNSLLFRDHPQK